MTRRTPHLSGTEFDLVIDTQPVHFTYVCGSGLSDLEVGLRLRYEFTRQFAPYIGVEWVGKFGGMADFAKAANENTDESRWVAGLRLWF